MRQQGFFIAHGGRRQSGFTLVEAMIALLVMTFGLLAFAGVQTTLRSNADISKQRTEAVRLAQQRIENLRAYTTLATFDALASSAAETLSVAQANTTYTRTVTVIAYPAGATGVDVVSKQIQVLVSWTDRGGNNQSVNLTGSIARADPSLATNLAQVPTSGPVRNPLNRNIRIPTTAIDFGDGTSGFEPPNSGGKFFVIDNTNAGVLQTCTKNDPSQTLSSDSKTNSVCPNTPGYFVSGSVSFNLNNSLSGNPRLDDPPTTACGFYKDAQNLPSTAACPNTSSIATGFSLGFDIQFTATSGSSSLMEVFYSNITTAVTTTDTKYVNYFGVISFPTNTIAPTWSGTLVLTGSPVDARYTVCRFFDANGDGVTTNDEHPDVYGATPNSPVNKSLTDQNFLVIKRSQNCPSQTVTAGNPGDRVFIYYKTAQLQPSP